MAGVGRVRLGTACDGGRHLPVLDLDAPRLPVQLEEHPDVPLRVRLPDGEAPDDEGEAPPELDRNFLPRGQSVEVDVGREDRHRAVPGAVLRVVDEDLRVHEVRLELLVRERPPGRRLGLRPFRPEVRGRERGARAPVDRLLALQDLPRESFREPARRAAELPPEQADDRLGKRDLAVDVLDVRPGEATGNHHEGEVADYLRGRGDLDDVAEHPVHLGIGARHLVPAVGESEGACLLAQVRELPPRHLVQVDLRGGGAHVGLERGVLGADRLPVVGELPDAGRIEPGVPRLAPQRLDDRAETGLGGEARETVHREVDRVDPRVHRGEHARRRDT